VNRTLRRAFPWLTGLVGLVITVPAAMHTVAVMGIAYRQRGGYDARLADLLWIGWTSLACGLLMVAAVPALRRGSAVALRTSSGAAAVFLGGTLLIAPVSPSFLTGLPIFGGYLVVAALVSRRDVTIGHVPRVAAGARR
jgi:hypothetical protein